MGSKKKKKQKQVQRLRHILTMKDLAEYLAETKKGLVIPIEEIEKIMMKAADNIIEQYKREGRIKRVLKKEVRTTREGCTTTVDSETPDGYILSADVHFPFLWGTVDLGEVRRRPSKYFVLKG